MSSQPETNQNPDPFTSVSTRAAQSHGIQSHITETPTNSDPTLSTTQPREPRHRQHRQSKRQNSTFGVPIIDSELPAACGLQRRGKYSQESYIIDPDCSSDDIVPELVVEAFYPEFHSKPQFPKHKPNSAKETGIYEGRHESHIIDPECSSDDIVHEFVIEALYPEQRPKTPRMNMKVEHQLEEPWFNKASTSGCSVTLLNQSEEKLGYKSQGAWSSNSSPITDTDSSHNGFVDDSSVTWRNIPTEKLDYKSQGAWLSNSPPITDTDSSPNGFVDDSSVTWRNIPTEKLEYKSQGAWLTNSPKSAEKLDYQSQGAWLSNSSPINNTDSSYNGIVGDSSVARLKKSEEKLEYQSQGAWLSNSSPINATGSSHNDIVDDSSVAWLNKSEMKLEYQSQGAWLSNSSHINDTDSSHNGIVGDSSVTWLKKSEEKLEYQSQEAWVSEASHKFDPVSPEGTDEDFSPSLCSKSSDDVAYESDGFWVSQQSNIIDTDYSSNTVPELAEDAERLDIPRFGQNLENKPGTTDIKSKNAKDTFYANYLSKSQSDQELERKTFNKESPNINSGLLLAGINDERTIEENLIRNNFPVLSKSYQDLDGDEASQEFQIYNWPPDDIDEDAMEASYPASSPKPPKNSLIKSKSYQDFEEDETYEFQINDANGPTDKIAMEAVYPIRNQKHSLKPNSYQELELDQINQKAFNPAPSPRDPLRESNSSQELDLDQLNQKAFHPAPSPKDPSAQSKSSQELDWEQFSQKVLHPLPSRMDISKSRKLSPKTKAAHQEPVALGTPLMVLDDLSVPVCQPGNLTRHDSQRIHFDYSSEETKPKIRLKDAAPVVKNSKVKNCRHLILRIPSEFDNASIMSKCFKFKATSTAVKSPSLEHQLSPRRKTRSFRFRSTESETGSHQNTRYSRSSYATLAGTNTPESYTDDVYPSLIRDEWRGQRSNMPKSSTFINAADGYRYTSLIQSAFRGQRSFMFNNDASGNRYPPLIPPGFEGQRSTVKGSEPSSRVHYVDGRSAISHRKPTRSSFHPNNWW